MSDGMQLGRYSLHAQLAAGGMATVYLARLNGAVGFGRTVAIKRLHPHLAKDPEFVTMFLDEARLSARIQHPNVVPTLDVVATDGELFLVLEYVKGETLSVLNRAMARQKAQIPVPIVASLVVGMLSGLDAAHEARDERGAPLEIVHRDVSPQNVMVGADGVARLLDFGIAKAASRLGNTREGQLKGKIAYMAPEQLMGQVSRQTDIYAAGVVLWEELTGRRLFYAETEVHTMSLVQKGDIPRPSSMNPAVPGALDDVVLKALAKQPEHRYRTAHEMAAAIEAVTELASPNRISEWLRGVAGELIDARAKLVKDIESGVNALGPMQVFDQLRAPGVQDSGPYPAMHRGSGSNPSFSNPGTLPPASSPSHPRPNSVPPMRHAGSMPPGSSGAMPPFMPNGMGPPDPNFVPTQSASTVSLTPPKAASRNRAIFAVGGAIALLVLLGVAAAGIGFARRGTPTPVAVQPLPTMTIPTRASATAVSTGGEPASEGPATSATTAAPSTASAVPATSQVAKPGVPGGKGPTGPKPPPPPTGKNPKNGTNQGNDLDNLLDSR